MTKWLKEARRHQSQRDEPLFEISTDKVDAEIPSPAAGTLKEIKIAGGHDGHDQHRRRTIDEAVQLLPQLRPRLQGRDSSSSRRGQRHSSGG
jgi:hypothetical protein